MDELYNDPDYISFRKHSEMFNHRHFDALAKDISQMPVNEAVRTVSGLQAMDTKGKIFGLLDALDKAVQKTG